MRPGWRPIRNTAGFLLSVVVLAYSLSACSESQPDPDRLVEAGDCQTLYDRTAEFLIDYVDYANGRPLEEAISTAPSGGAPILVAGMRGGVLQAQSQAHGLGCDDLLEQLRRAGTRARDAAESTTSRLLVAQFENGQDMRALGKALTVVLEAQEAYRKSLGIYAGEVSELEARMPTFARVKDEKVDMTVVWAGQDRYCVTVQAHDLPPVHLQEPGMRLSADGCEKPPT